MTRFLALTALALALPACQRSEGVTGEPGTNQANVVTGNEALGGGNASDAQIQQAQRNMHEEQRQRMGVNAPPGTGKVGQGGTGSEVAIPNGTAGGGTNTGVGPSTGTTGTASIGATGASGTGATKPSG